MMRSNFFSILLIAQSFLILQCAPFRDSPYSDQVLRAERELNTKSIKRIQNSEDDGILSFAVFSDSHQNYKALDQVVVQINKAENIDFVVNLGDFTNSGYNLEYDQFLDSYLLIQPPVISVLGNHDAIGAGPAIFKRVFGESNVWFETQTYRFIIFNSSNLEDPSEFSPQWLKQVVESSAKPIIIFTHAHLKDEDRFTGETAQIFSDVINNPKTQMILNGHNHVYDYQKEAGTILLQCGRTEGRQWLMVDISANQLSVRRMESGEQVWDTLKN